MYGAVTAEPAVLSRGFDAVGTTLLEQLVPLFIKEWCGDLSSLFF